MRTPFLLLCGLLTVFGCAPSAKDAAPGDTRDDVPASTQAVNSTGGEFRFQRALLFLPSGFEKTSPEQLLAPIIIHETGGDYEAERPGWIDGEEEDRLVYLLRTEVEINGTTHPQFSYCWQYTTSAKKEETTAHSTKILRMTFDSDGYPAVFEVMDGEGEISSLHISKGLEQAAGKEYGSALAGRSYSIEGIKGSAVAGLVDEGPIAMGPMVYVGMSQRRVMALTCRCAPSKVRKADDSLSYKIRLLASPAPGSIDFLNNIPSPDRTLRTLRIPQDF